MSFTDRTKILVKDVGLEKLKAAHICVFGLGGVGAAAAMDLVRFGLGTITVIDFDVINESNLNRLYFAYLNDCGRLKVDAFADYAYKINPQLCINSFSKLLHSDDIELPLGCDFYIDCIDTLNPKVNLLAGLVTGNHNFVSVMGTAGRMQPERLKVTNIWKSYGCTLASRVRSRLRRRGFTDSAKFLSIWSDEPAVKPVTNAMSEQDSVRIRATQGSSPFVPQAAGHIAASIAARHILSL